MEITTGKIVILCVCIFLMILAIACFLILTHISITDAKNAERGVESVESVDYGLDAVIYMLIIVIAANAAIGMFGQ